MKKEGAFILGWFEWGSGNGNKTENGVVSDKNNTNVGWHDNTTVYDTNNKPVGEINSDSTVTWGDGSVSNWHKD